MATTMMNRSKYFQRLIFAIILLALGTEGCFLRGQETRPATTPVPLSPDFIEQYKSRVDRVKIGESGHFAAVRNHVTVDDLETHGFQPVKGIAPFRYVPGLDFGDGLFNQVKDTTCQSHFFAATYVDPYLKEYEEGHNVEYLFKACEYCWDLYGWEKKNGYHAFSLDSHPVGLRMLRIAFIADKLYRGETEETEKWIPRFEEMAKDIVKRLRDTGWKDIEKIGNNNHWVFGTFGWMAFGQVFGHLEFAKDMRTEALRAAEILLNGQFTAEGFHREHSSSRHITLYSLFKDIYQSRWFGEIPPILEQIRQNRFWHLQPDGYLLPLGDTSGMHSGFTMPPSEVDFYKSPLKHAPETGYAFVKNDPNCPVEDSFHLAFTGTHFSDTHKHSDDLSFILFEGRPLLVDAGMHSNHEKSSEFRYVRSTRAHNTVEIDGIDQINLEQLKVMAEKYGSAIYLAKETPAGWLMRGRFHMAYGDVYHDRTLLYREGKYLIVRDSLSSKKEHEYVQWFHLHPDARIPDTPDADTVEFEFAPKDSEYPGKNVRYVKPARTVFIRSHCDHPFERIIQTGSFDEKKMPSQGWYCPKEHEITPNCAVGYRTKGDCVVMTTTIGLSQNGLDDAAEICKDDGLDRILETYDDKRKTLLAAEQKARKNYVFNRSVTCDKNSSRAGESVTWTCHAEGDDLEYAWYVYKNDELIKKVVPYQKENTLTFTPSESGRYCVFSFTQNKNVKKTRSSVHLEVFDPEDPVVKEILALNKYDMLQYRREFLGTQPLLFHNVYRRFSDRFKAIGEHKKPKGVSFLQDDACQINFDTPFDWQSIDVWSRDRQQLFHGFVFVLDSVPIDTYLNAALAWINNSNSWKELGNLWSDPKWHDVWTALRFRAFCHIFDSAFRNKDVDDEKIKQLFESLVLHVEYLSNERCLSSSDHGFYQLSAFLAGIHVLQQTLRDLPVESIKKISMARFEKNMYERICHRDEGGPLDGSNMYLRLHYDAVALLAHHDLIPEFTPLLENVKVKMERPLYYTLIPSGNQVFTAGRWASPPPGVSISFELLGRTIDKNAPPLTESERFGYFPKSGFVAYKDIDNYLYFNSSFFSKHYKHAEDNAFYWMENNRPIVVYYAGKLWAPFGMTSLAHSTVEINGLPTPFKDVTPYGSGIKDGKYDPDTKTVFCTGSVQFADARHMRKIVYKPGNHLLVLDHLVPAASKKNTYRQNFVMDAAWKLKEAPDDPQGFLAELASEKRDESDLRFLSISCRSPDVTMERENIHFRTLNTSAGDWEPSTREGEGTPSIRFAAPASEKPVLIATLFQLGETRPRSFTVDRKDGKTATVSWKIDSKKETYDIELLTETDTKASAP